MKEDDITVKTYYYLPMHFLWAILLATGAAFLFSGGRFLLAIISLTLAVLVATAHYGIKINIPEKTYTDFLSMLWIVSGEEKKFETIDYVFIKSSKKSQNMNSLATSRTFTDDFYDGYIKFDGNEKIYLMSHKKKETVMKVLRELAGKTGVEVVDHTETAES